jgi:hypothetical protein
MNEEKEIIEKFTMLSDRDKNCLMSALSMFTEFHETTLFFTSSDKEYKDKYPGNYTDVNIHFKNERDIVHVWKYYGVAQAKMTTLFDWFFETKQKTA